MIQKNSKLKIMDHELKIKSVQYRKRILKYIKLANMGHTSGSLSCVEILNVLYNRILNVSPESFTDPKRDRYIQSKGHSVEALYVVLADCGFFPESDLETLCQYKSHYVGHPTRKINGIEHNTGALGHGLAFSGGVAIGAKMVGDTYHVFTLLGDGELIEGSNWEAVFSAAHYRLDKLTAIIDHNTLQITGRTKDVMNSEPLAEKFRAFGWAVRTVNGHDVRALTDVLESVPFEGGKPNLVIANTVKGKGVSFIEDDPIWHHHVPNEEQYNLAINELDEVLSALKAEGGENW